MLAVGAFATLCPCDAPVQQDEHNIPQKPLAY